jgi:hypothetical protein
MGSTETFEFGTVVWLALRDRLGSVGSAVSGLVDSGAGFIGGALEGSILLAELMV